MDPRLKNYYNRELQHLREVGGEFAKEFPKIAGRLALDEFECADPYVERLLEGFAFLSSRVQLKLDSQFPQFTQHLLECIYPHYLAPTPSMAIAEFQPDLTEGSLAAGFKIPRHSSLRSMIGKGEQTPCEYRTSQDVTLWPIKITEAKYYSKLREVGRVDPTGKKKVRAAIRLTLETTAGLSFDALPLENLPLYFRGPEEVPVHIFEQFFSDALGVLVRSHDQAPPWNEKIDPVREGLLGKNSIRRLGFDDDHALLPYGLRSFQGYRLLHEYFAFPQRFLFADLKGLNPSLKRIGGKKIDIYILLDRGESRLENILSEENFSLYCVPIINLFPKRADRINVNDRTSEYHIVPDRTRPLDFEVYQVLEVLGHGTRKEQETEFRPFYASTDLTSHRKDLAYYTLIREPRMLSQKQRRYGPRSSYIGSEVHLSLVDGTEAPYSENLRQLSLDTLCTNRDLPLHMPIGQGRTDFNLKEAAPVNSIKCINGPTRPRASFALSGSSWRLISHLTLNYLSLVDSNPEEGASALRELLSLYAEDGNAQIRKQVEGVRSISSKPITRRITGPGPLAFARGLEIQLDLDEASFEGTGAFLIGSVLEQFFTKYVSLNSFTETVISTVERGEVIRWPMRTGRRQVL